MSNPQQSLRGSVKNSRLSAFSNYPSFWLFGSSDLRWVSSRRNLCKLLLVCWERATSSGCIMRHETCLRLESWTGVRVGLRVDGPCVLPEKNSPLSRQTQEFSGIFLIFFPTVQFLQFLLQSDIVFSECNIQISNFEKNRNGTKTGMHP